LRVNPQVNSGPGVYKGFRFVEFLNPNKAGKLLITHPHSGTFFFNKDLECYRLSLTF
jgi:hypothetical protein